jgi:hypothetical protein
MGFDGVIRGGGCHFRADDDGGGCYCCGPIGRGLEECLNLKVLIDV